MTPDEEQRFDRFLESLRDIPWFAKAGQPTSNYRVVPDAVVAWDDWSPQKIAVWNPRSEELERVARAAIGDATIDTVFTRVDESIGAAVQDGLGAYFARRPGDTENTEIDVDLGLRREILDTVIRDMSWAAVETILERPGFYASLLPVYRNGRWPASWEGRYPSGRFVVL